MIGLAIGILWFALGVVVVGGCIAIALWLVKQVVAVPALVDKVVWGVFLIICLIYLLTLLEGGALPHPAFLRG